VERPRRVVRFARLIHRPGRAFGPTFGLRHLWRQSQLDPVATHSGSAPGAAGTLHSPKACMIELTLMLVTPDVAKEVKIALSPRISQV
jgi:hypothetical protein